MLRALSPSFHHCIDINKTLNQFVVRDTFTLNELYRIPKHFMDPSKENPKEIMARFEWIDEDTIKLSNREGIEKILEMKDDFSEREYNVIPLFDNAEL